MAVSFPTIPAFNISLLNSYNSADASLPLAEQASALTADSTAATVNSESTAAATSTAGKSAGSAATPPWISDPTTPTPTTQSVFLDASEPIFNTQNSTTGRSDVSSDYQGLFTLYQGLTEMQSLATYASSNSSASQYTSELNNAFQGMLQQYYSYVNSLSLKNVTVIPGLEEDTTVSNATQPTAPVNYTGSFVTNDPDQPIPGLSTSDQFTISATDSSGNTYNQVIDLSQVQGPLTLDNVASYINAQLKAGGTIGATFSVVQSPSGTGYSLSVTPGYNQTLSLTPDTASATPAAYVAGTSGGGSEGVGYLTKFNLSGATPGEVFQQNINTQTPASTPSSTSPSTPSTTAPSSPSGIAAASTGGGITADATATDSEGNVYVVGSTEGNLDGEVNVGTSDLYLQKYSPSGQLIYSEMLGASNAQGVSVAVDSSGNVVVAGTTTDQLTPGSTNTGNTAFVTKFDPTGQQVFTYQSQPAAGDSATGLAVDAQGDIFLSGTTASPVGGDVTQSGTTDAFVTKLDPNGNVLYDTQSDGGAGTSASDTSVAVDNAGNYYMLTNINGDAILSKYADAAGSQPIYTTNLGQVGQGAATGLALDGQGNVYVTGTTTSGTLNGQVNSAYTSGSDAFVSQVNASTGAINYVSYVGGGNTDASALSVSGGDVYITGSTNEPIANATPVGTQDSYFATLDGSSGQVTSAQEWGGAFSSTGSGITVDPTGTSALSVLGLPNGDVPPDGSTAQTVTEATSARGGDELTLAINGGPPQTVTLQTDDSFGYLAFRINQVLGTNGIASVNSSGQLQIKAINNAQVTVGNGPAGENLLTPLGMTPMTLYGGAPGQLAVTTSSYKPSATTLAQQQTANSNPSIFALGFVSNMNLSTKGSATSALDLINNALLQVKDAYSYMVNGPTKKTTPANANTGTVSPLLQQQIGAYQQALAQITALNQSSSSSSAAATPYSAGMAAASTPGTIAAGLVADDTSTTSPSQSLDAGLIGLF